MTEHVHEWSVDHEVLEEISPLGTPYGRVFAYCGCGENIFNDEIVRRLNATEKLNAESARMASKALWELIEWAAPQLLGKRANITHSELEDYAAALEGE